MHNLEQHTLRFRVTNPNNTPNENERVNKKLEKHCVNFDALNITNRILSKQSNNKEYIVTYIQENENSWVITLSVQDQPINDFLSFTESDLENASNFLLDKIKKISDSISILPIIENQP